MANKKTKLLGVTLMSAAILCGGVATTTATLLLSNNVVYAEDAQEKVKISAIYGYNDGGTWITLLNDVYFLSPGESITITAKEFPGYTFMEFNGDDGYSFPSYTFTYDKVKSFNGFAIAPFTYSKNNTPTPPATQQPKTVTISYQDGTNAGDSIGTTITTKQFTVKPGGVLVIEAPDFPGYKLLGKPGDIPYDELEDGQTVYVSYIKSEPKKPYQPSTPKPTTPSSTVTKPTTPKSTTPSSTVTKPSTPKSSTPKTTTPSSSTQPSTTKPAPTETTIPVYRLYNPGLQVHLYTTDQNEVNVLKTRGWNYEGISWKTEQTKGDPVYRMYNEGLKVHLYTKDANEYKVLATRGWKQEGIAYRSYGNVPIYRMYHAGLRKHLYTRDANEYKVLATRGWKQEGIAWYSQP